MRLCMNQKKKIQMLVAANQIIGKLPPLQQKSRYFTAKELDKKIKKAVKILNLKEELKIIKLRRENVFAIYSEN